MSSQYFRPNVSRRGFTLKLRPLMRNNPVIFALRTWAIWDRRKSIIIIFVCAAIVSQLRDSASTFFFENPLWVGRFRPLGYNHREGHLDKHGFVAPDFASDADKFQTGGRHQLIRVSHLNTPTAPLSYHPSASSGSCLISL